MTPCPEGVQSLKVLVAQANPAALGPSSAAGDWWLRRGARTERMLGASPGRVTRCRYFSGKRIFTYILILQWAKSSKYHLSINISTISTPIFGDQCAILKHVQEFHWNAANSLKISKCSCCSFYFSIFIFCFKFPAFQLVFLPTSFSKISRKFGQQN